MDMEKAAATTTEEEEEEQEEQELLMVVVVVDLQVNSTEVEETGEVGHRNRDPKGWNFLVVSLILTFFSLSRHSRIEMSPMSRQ